MINDSGIKASERMHIFVNGHLIKQYYYYLTEQLTKIQTRIRR